MLYNVITTKNIDFSSAPRADISCYKWGDGYEPAAYAQLIYVDGEGFMLHMHCDEADPKAIYTSYNDPVYKDSCLEFFVSFNANSPLYMNFEMNSNGAFLSAVRSDRKNKTPIDQLCDLPEVKASRNADGWNVDVFFSLEMINKLFGECKFAKGSTFKGNFYKCGDETAQPHFGMWSPVDLPSPDFHRPEFFGEFKIV